jgi:Cu/Zn superoxide dismutase
VAQITGVNGEAVTGTATFTQGATMTQLVINLSACPNGKHSSHLHVTKDCGNNGNAAGGHWIPNGENLGDYTCADNKGMHTVQKPTSQWTVGDGSDTDVTKRSFMVHESGDDEGSGDRIGCGVISKP